MRNLVLAAEDMRDLLAGGTINAMIEGGEEVATSAPDRPDLFVVVHGNPKDGFRIVGPFTDHEVAINDCGNYMESAWVLPLEPAEEER